MEPFGIAMIVVLILSVVVHEMAHGYAADWLGDPTAKLSGRLSPNPLVHLDPLGSVILPALLIFSSATTGVVGPVFGWAKPVPYNPYNFTNQKWGEAIVAIAGPASNIVIAIIFAVLIRLSDVLSLSSSFVQLAEMVIILNIFLAFFNLVPIPPLDGSKILPRFLPFAWRMQYDKFRMLLEQNIMVAFVVIILVFWYILSGPLYFLTLRITQALVGF